MGELRVITEPLGGGPLAAAAIRGTARADWFEPPPAGVVQWRQRAAEVSRHDRRWLDALRPAFGDGARLDRLERAAAGSGLVVTTGQQPGLFGGPIYTLSKALSALALADAIELATGVPTAPVFWAATDDADFAEASVTHVAVPGGVETLRMAVASTDGVPMARVPLGETRALIDQLLRGAGSGSNGDVVEALRRSYDGRPATTVGDAYTALLRELLEPLGFAVLDASHAAVRVVGAELMRCALDRAAAVEGALARRAAELGAVGLVPQVPSVAGLSLVFANAPDGSKRRIPVADAATLARSAADEALSPNVLLRPVLERAILPTVGYVAGPGEIAYFAQVSAVARALNAAVPVAVPRWSGTVIEPHVTRVLARLDLVPDDLRDPHAAETRLARAQMPAELGEALHSARAAVTDALDRVRRASGGDVVPASVIDGSAARLVARVDRLERRYVAAFKARETGLMFELATVRGALWPLGHRQERTLNFIPLLARHGPDLVRQMRERAGEAMQLLVRDGAAQPAHDAIAG